MWRTWVGVALLSCLGAAAAQESETSPADELRGVGTKRPTRSSMRYRQHYGTYHALLIGVSDYKSDDDKPLDTPVKDVRALKKSLETVLGWKNVSTLVDAEVTEANVKAALENYARELTINDNLFIWFAGHGREAEAKHDWFWVMQNGTRLKFQGVLKDRLELIRARHLLVVSDSCFAGVDTADTFHPSSDSDLNLLRIRESSQLITSGDVEAVPDSGILERTGERSPFAHAFLQYIKAMPTRKVPQTAWQMFEEVRMAAIAATPEGSQTAPRCGFFAGNESDSGQFFFVPPGFYAEQKSRAQMLERTELTRAQRDLLQPLGRIHGKPVFARKDSRTANDSEPMVLVEKTNVTLEDGSKEPVEPFLIDVREVTVRQFKRFLAESGDRRGTRYLTAPGFNSDDQPIVGVTLAQARAYAAWAGKELPDEHQWRAAAVLRWVKNAEGKSAVEAAEYTWSDRNVDLAAELAWKAFPPEVTSETRDISPWGVERMGSGVREWCLRADRALGRGVIMGGSVVRASSRDTRERWIISKSRSETRDDIPSANVGFRCIVTLDPPRKARR